MVAKSQLFPAALNYYSMAISLKPDFADAYLERAICYLNTNFYDSAITDANECIKLEPNNQDAYYVRGAAFQWQSKDSMAIADFTKTIELSPQDRDAFYARGLSYENLKMYPEALSSYETAFKLYSGYPGLEERIKRLKEKVK
jgi:tetratricopeptide (TPR) repeat protein